MIPWRQTHNTLEDMYMKKATVAILKRGDRILLGRKQGSPEIGAGTLNGPGGKMEEPDRTLVDCVIRETREELGIELNPDSLKKVAIITFYAGETPYMEVHFYSSDDFLGEPSETKSMVPEWHEVDRIPFDRMLESDKDWFPKLLKGEKFNATVYYRGKAEGYIRTESFPFDDHD
jgi:8-oxo-dGTP diphosphatase